MSRQRLRPVSHIREPAPFELGMHIKTQSIILNREKKRLRFPGDFNRHIPGTSVTANVVQRLL